MIAIGDTKLADYESEDIDDVIVKLEKSFGLQFSNNAFQNVKTFGDLCDVFEEHMTYEHFESCTTQQAFYKIRKAIAHALLIEEKVIKPDTNLDELFPKHNRRHAISLFEKSLGFKIDVFVYPDWLFSSFAIGFLGSLIAFFFDWKIAVSGLIFFFFMTKVADSVVKDFSIQTISELVMKLTKENYMVVRGHKNSINRKEVLSIITDTFCEALDIEKENLTRASKFSWA